MSIKLVKIDEDDLMTSLTPARIVET